MNLENAVNELRKSLKTDEGLYYSYQSNIAMAFYDEAMRQGIVHSELLQIANDAAKSFLNSFIKK